MSGTILWNKPSKAKNLSNSFYKVRKILVTIFLNKIYNIFNIQTMADTVMTCAETIKTTTVMRVLTSTIIR